MWGLRRKDDGLFEPRMPDVDASPTLAALFTKARSTAADGAQTPGDPARRCVVSVTPGRLLMLQPCPPPGSMSEEQVAGIQKLLPPQPRRNIVAIGYTELAALQANISKAVPFMGMLLGFAYIGHAVWLFEGHRSALADGCRHADILLADGAMVPHLQADWQTVAGSNMRRPEIYIHDRATFRLSRARQAEAVS